MSSVFMPSLASLSRLNQDMVDLQEVMSQEKAILATSIPNQAPDLFPALTYQPGSPTAGGPGHRRSVTRRSGFY